jgi:hypothetical protein
MHHDDAVGILDGGQAVGNHDGGAILHQVFQRSLYQPLGLGIQRRRRFIQNQQRCVFQQCAAMARR